MDRLEYIRIKTDRILDVMENSISCKLAYIHSYGVSQMAALLAKKRNLNIDIIKVVCQNIAVFQQFFIVSVLYLFITVKSDSGYDDIDFFFREFIARLVFEILLPE